MDPLERSARLRREADDVLGELHLLEILQPYGRAVLAGSYYLDAMAYPDIDLYMRRVTVGELFQVAAQVAACERVVQVVFERSKDPALPGGLYLKVRVDYGDWGRPWKIDIWSLDEAAIDRIMAEMDRFRAAMTPQLRGQIIAYKHSVLTAEGRTPMYSGYWIYKAFLDEGLSDPQDVMRYLVAHGIKMR